MPELDSLLAAGADVSVRAWARKPDDGTATPANAQRTAVSAAMATAMAAILTAAGFTVSGSDNDYAPHQLRVTAGRGEGVEPSWALRGEERALPYREQTNDG